jgi:hypothetical protein
MNDTFERKVRAAAVALWWVALIALWITLWASPKGPCQPAPRLVQSVV